MNIKIDRTKLFPKLKLVSSMISKKQAVPIQSHVFFKNKDGKLKMVGTDLEVEISEIIEGVEGDNVIFTVSARKILDICRALPKDSIISFKVHEGQVTISSGRIRYTLQSLDAHEFPKIDVNQWEDSFKINQISLKSLLDKTSFSMAFQDVRYYLNGILFELTSNRLMAIATDGHRLAKSEVDIKFNMKEVRQLIVPRKAITEIHRFLDRDHDMELTVEINSNHLKLTKGETVLITKLIDGKFPELNGILATKTDIVVNLRRLEFIEAMNRAAVLTSDRFRGIKISLYKGSMKILVKNVQNEEAVEEIMVNYQKKFIETGYNVSYLIDVARVIESSKLQLNLQENNGVCIIKEPNDLKSVWLIMPMRL